MEALEMVAMMVIMMEIMEAVGMEMMMQWWF